MADTSDAPELKPCPFCGSVRIVHDAFATTGYTHHVIRCRCCAAEGPWSKSESGARRAWNRRVEPEGGERG